jgi:predicted RNase H-like nuclease (RuvC/YqgF family)
MIKRNLVFILIIAAILLGIGLLFVSNKPTTQRKSLRPTPEKKAPVKKKITTPPPTKKAAPTNPTAQFGVQITSVKAQIKKLETQMGELTKNQEKTQNELKVVTVKEGATTPPDAQIMALKAQIKKLEAQIGELKGVVTEAEERATDAEERSEANRLKLRVIAIVVNENSFIEKEGYNKSNLMFINKDWRLDRKTRFVKLNKDDLELVGKNFNELEPLE